MIPRANCGNNVDHLTSEQAVVKQILREETAVFVRHKDKLGCIKNLKIDSKLTDDVPVAKTYKEIPQPLYDD